MTAQEISRATLAAILASGVDYVLVGGFAVNAYALPRSTVDVDFVVAAPMGSIDRIALHFPREFHVDPQPQMELLTGTYRWIVDIDDAQNILAVQGDAIDYAHIEMWCARHGTLERLAEVRAGIPPGL